MNAREQSRAFCYAVFRFVTRVSILSLDTRVYNVGRVTGTGTPIHQLQIHPAILPNMRVPENYRIDRARAPFSVLLGVPPSITVFIGRVRLFLFLCNTGGVPTIYRFIVQGAENGLAMRFFCVRYRSSPSYMTVQNRRSSYTRQSVTAKL